MTDPQADQQAAAELNSQMRIDVRDFDLPEVVTPEAELNGRGRLSRCSTPAGPSPSSASASSHPRHTTRANFRIRMPHRPPATRPITPRR